MELASLLISVLAKTRSVLLSGEAKGHKAKREPRMPKEMKCIECVTENLNVFFHKQIRHTRHTAPLIHSLFAT
jgi:hypothetical protein